MKSFKNIPWHTLLLPLFFVLHGYADHYGFISMTDAASLALNYVVMAVCILLFSLIIFRNLKKAALMTAAWMAVYLFFGAFFDFLKANSPISLLFQYRFLGPFFVILLLVWFVYLKKSRNDFTKVTLFLNILLCIFIAVEIIKISLKAANPVQHQLSFFDFKSNSIKIPDTCKQPDIYFLLFDEYESSLSLKERYGFENDIDSFLLKEGFSIQSNSISNYNNTPFSMASILNMEYLPWVGEQMLVKRKDYMECIPRINENRVIGALGSHGYDIVNLSMFDLAGNPSQIKQAFLPVKTKMIAEGTLFPRLYRDFAWAFKKYKLLAHVVSNQDIYQHDTNNQFFIEEVKKHAAAKTARPKFLYAHFYLPHGPYFYDEKGAPQPLESVILPDAYLKYVRYTNLRMKEMIRVIKDGSKSEAIIVILSDHGFRTSTTERHPDWHFKNLNAMYFPDGHYNHLYSDMSNVNTFRAIFNQVFAQNLPMLKDSTIYLIDLNLGDIRRK